MFAAVTLAHDQARSSRDLRLSLETLFRSLGPGLEALSLGLSLGLKESWSSSRS